MCPEFFRLGSFALRAWGVALTLSFFLGLWLLKFEARALRLNYDRLFNLGFLVSFVGVVGARLAYVVFHFSEFADKPLNIINPLAVEGQFGIAGMNLYGGIILAVVVAIIYLSRRRLSILDHADAVVVALAFGIFLSRIGCFLNGCCFGTPTGSFLGMVFPPDSPAGWVYPGEHIHPAQLYASGLGLLLFFVLRRVNRHRRFSGQAFALFFMLQSAFRFFLEFIRYYEPAMTLGSQVGGFTYNQVIAVAFFLFGATIYLVGLKKVRGTAAPNRELEPNKPDKNGR